MLKLIENLLNSNKFGPENPDKEERGAQIC